ncbi:MAG: BON domain-containing protein [Planctomycetaceae bacterium]|nr:BON domain-containing protein [Planctomycetaceae bacterium]
MPQTLQFDQTHEVRDLVRNTLARNPHFNGRDLRVDFDQHDVIIRGAVKSYYQKQIAQESVRRITGIGAIRNELEVVSA